MLSIIISESFSAEDGAQKPLRNNKVLKREKLSNS